MLSQSEIAEKQQETDLLLLYPSIKEGEHRNLELESQRVQPEQSEKSESQGTEKGKREEREKMRREDENRAKMKSGVKEEMITKGETEYGDRNAYESTRN